MKNGNFASNWGGGVKLIALSLLCAAIASCSTTSHKTQHTKRHSKEYFSEKEYGVKASPRVYQGRNVPKGGGRLIIGKPYKVKGKWYEPKEDKSYNKVGLASWYGSAFHGRLTANGEVYDQYHLSAAHPTFPLPSYARVTNVVTGDSVIVRVNDRGPYHAGRIIDLSNKAAEMLDIQHHGTGKVRVQYLGKARMDGHDMPFLMASYSKKGDRLKRFNPAGEIATGVLVASNDRKMRIPESDQSSEVELTSTATALQSTDLPVAVTSFDAMQEYAVLPEFGPIPAERPNQYENNNGALSAYAEMSVDEASKPFDAVLGARSRLNPESIRSAVARKNKTLF